MVAMAPRGVTVTLHLHEPLQNTHQSTLSLIILENRGWRR
jgi:hypothetical protein